MDRQSENSIDGRPRASGSPSIGHAAAPVFRMLVRNVHAVNIRAAGCTSRRPMLAYSGPFPKPVRGTLTGHIVQGEHRHGTIQDASAEGSRSHYEQVPKPLGFEAENEPPKELSVAYPAGTWQGADVSTMNRPLTDCGSLCTRAGA